MTLKNRFSLATIAGLALAGGWIVSGSYASPPRGDAHLFQGYWVGTDPLDGGDSRRGMIAVDASTVSMIGRDSYFSLCDGTDRGVVSFEDGFAEDGVLTTDNNLLKCFNNGEEILLKARYELVDDSIMNETITTQDDVLITTIIFHRISTDAVRGENQQQAKVRRSM